LSSLLLLLLMLLQDGKLVEAKVIWVGETEVKVVIQSNGMEAIIPQVRCGVYVVMQTAAW
jgi:hypothetical protein